MSSKQIREREQDYQKKLEALCVKYALDFKNILIEEYGVIILELGRLPLSQHFGFRLDNYVRRVTEEKITQAVSVKILGRVKEHIMQQYNTFKKGVVKARSFKKVIDFIKGYQEFSSYFEREFSMSNIKYQQDSEELAPKSWLIENLRYMFPKRFGLPLKDDLLSWFVYGDIPGYGKTSKVKWTTNIEGISRRIPFADLLAIDYRVNKLTKKAFSDKGIEVSTEGLEILKKSVSFLIYYYVFGGYHEPTYVSEITSKGLKVGRGYFTIEYKVIRAIFFAAAEANNGESMYFEGINGINSASGISTDLKNHLYQGFGFGDDLIKLVKYINTIFKSRPPDSSCKIFHDAKEVLEGYLDDYKARHRILLQESQEYASIFQGRVHKSMEDFFGLKFVSEEQVRAVVKETYVTTINDNGVKEKIYVHGVFKFDLYLELTNALKDYLGLDDKWMGLAIEALGTYWHSLPKQKEADRKKRLICRERNIILLEIPEAMDRSEWCTEALKQFKELTGVEIPRNKLSELYKYLGNA